MKLSREKMKLSPQQQKAMDKLRSGWHIEVRVHPPMKGVVPEFRHASICGDNFKHHAILMTTVNALINKGLITKTAELDAGWTEFAGERVMSKSLIYQVTQ